MVGMQVDIVGGSLSGLSTALSIKEHNPSIDVIVHEKYKIIGYNPEGRRCGEAHNVEREWSKWKPVEKSIFDRITKGSVIVGKHSYHATRPPGVAYILNRQEFICQLARDAEKLNVRISTGDKIRSVDDLDGAYIVDASGCPSSIKRELGFGTGPVGVTYQQTVEDANCFIDDTVQLIFTPILGYYWMFPRNPEKREMNIGIGTLGDLGYNLRELLGSFKEQHHITGTITYVVGGLIPLGLQHPLMFKNIFFVGDAGVGTFPLSGQGIYRALMSGDIAGRCIGTNQQKKYPMLIYHDFLKWNLIGLNYIRMSFVLRKINPKLFLPSLNMLTKVGRAVNQITP
jgi:flavin-dependent dehydrogenase